MDFFEEDCVEEFLVAGAAEEGGDFGCFGWGGERAGEGVHSAVEGGGGGVAVLEEELEDGWVGVVGGWGWLVGV